MIKLNFKYVLLILLILLCIINYYNPYYFSNIFNSILDINQNNIKPTITNETKQIKKEDNDSELDDNVSLNSFKSYIDPTNIYDGSIN